MKDTLAIHIALVALMGLHLLPSTTEAVVYADGTLWNHNHHASGTGDDDRPVAFDFSLGPTSPGTWSGSGSFGSSANVSWSLMPSGVNCSAEGAGTSSALSSFMPAGFKTEIENALDAWADVTGLIFTEVSDDGVAFNASPTSGHGDIRIGGHFFDGGGGILAHGFYPPVNGNTAAGDIHFDTADTWKIGFGGSGFDIFQVSAHEIGHAIGLAHESVETALMNPFYSESFSGLLADDIEGGQHIYGLAGIPEPATIVLALPVLLFLRMKFLQRLMPVRAEILTWFKGGNLGLASGSMMTLLPSVIRARTSGTSRVRRSHRRRRRKHSPGY